MRPLWMNRHDDHFDHFFKKIKESEKNTQKVKSFGMEPFYVYYFLGKMINLSFDKINKKLLHKIARNRDRSSNQTHFQRNRQKLI